VIFGSHSPENSFESLVLPYNVCFFLKKHSRSSSSHAASCFPHTALYLIVLVTAIEELGSSSLSVYSKESVFAVREHCQLIELQRY